MLKLPVEASAVEAGPAAAAEPVTRPGAAAAAPAGARAAASRRSPAAAAADERRCGHRLPGDLAAAEARSPRGQ